jgi:hypothetical protein
MLRKTSKFPAEMGWRQDYKRGREWVHFGQMKAGMLIGQPYTYV